MENESKKQFKIRDRGFPAFAKSFDPNIPFTVDIPRPGKAEFITPANDRLYRLLADYNSNVPVPVQDFLENLRTVTDEMMDKLRKAGGVR